MSAPIPLAEADVRGVRLHFELPRALVLNANDRSHWAVKARVTKTLRDMGRYAAHSQQRMERAQVTIRIGWPDHRQRDVDNLAPTTKALIDGAVGDAGLLRNDSDAHLVRTIKEGYVAGRTGLTIVDLEFIEVA